MSRDPYLDVKGDVENNLASLQNLIASSSSATSHNGLAQEIRETVSLLEADIEDLEETVRAVESVGDRWGIPEGEKRARRQFVDRVKREVAALRVKIPQRPAKSGQAGVRYTDNPDAAERGGNGAARGREDAAEDPEEARRWEMEEQQMLVRQQDDTLGFISGTLHNLASQAGLIGTEVAIQSEMLDDLGNRVDDTDNRLKRASRKMQDFIRRNEETKSGYCICILIIVLIILLVLVILT